MTQSDVTSSTTPDAKPAAPSVAPPIAPTVAPPVATYPAHPATPRWSVRLTSLAAQAASVMFAVLIALAVDQWWEDRENAELARRATAAVAAELRGNLTQLETGNEQVSQSIATLDDAMPSVRTGSPEMDISVNYEVALFSSSAWQTAQTTRAVHFMPIERAVRIARVYELQGFAARTQEMLTEKITALRAQDGDSLYPALLDVHGRLVMIQGLRQALENGYHCLIAELDGTPVDPARDCDVDAADQPGPVQR